MTVAEHILFYSLLKGRGAKEAQEEVEDMLQNLTLRHKRTELAQNLSGLFWGVGSGPLRSVLGSGPLRSVLGQWVMSSQVCPGGQNLPGLSWGRGGEGEKGSGALMSVLRGITPTMYIHGTWPVVNRLFTNHKAINHNPQSMNDR